MEDGWITVITEYGSKRAKVHPPPPGHSLPPADLAEILHAEIIAEAIRRGRLKLDGC